MSIYTKGNARFTVMTEGVIRMEYATDGVFVDGETLFAKRDMMWDAAVTDGDVLTIETEQITLYYKGGEFSSDTLYADIHVDGFETKWHFGDTNKENLGGTLHTLDGVDGFRDLPDGLLARDGWYVIDDSATPFFRDGWIENRGEGHVIDMYLFAYGRNYKSALSDLAAVSGKFELPRKYFFGSWYSRWWPYTADEFLSIVNDYDVNDFPLDILVMDMDWHYQDWGHEEGEPKYEYGYGHAGGNLGWTGYTWNRRLIPDPEGIVSYLKDKGIAVTLNDHPCDGIRDADEAYPRFMAKLEEGGYTEELVPTIEEKVNDREKAYAEKGIKNYRFNAGSKAYMDAFFDASNSEMEDKGATFRWLDWQQDYLYPNVHGMNNLTHLKWLNHLYYENSKKGGKRGMSFSRWGGFGDHKHPSYFSGDTTTNWNTLAFQIQMTVSAGNVGCFWWSHDIGGFMDTVPGGQGEVYARWVQFGIMSPALRVHMCGLGDFDRRPWTWGEYSPIMRDAYHLRSVLMPYIYSEAKAATDFSTPLLRSLYIDFPEDEECYKHPGQYFFGEGIMTAPICKALDEDGFVESEIYVPDGVWYDYFTGERYTAGMHTVKNTLNTFPMFIRAGYPVVTQPYTSRMTATALTEPKILIYAGDSGVSTLFEDDGISNTDLGLCRITGISYDDADKIVRMECYNNSYDDGITERDVTFEIHGLADVANAVCDTNELAVSKDGDTLTITAKAVSVSGNSEIKIV